MNSVTNANYFENSMSLERLLSGLQKRDELDLINV
jgi:hypothetical protein